jgi:hypothetical protein
MFNIILSPFKDALNALSWAMSAGERRRMIAFRVKLARANIDQL